MKIGQSAGKDYAYILGVYLGDGCVQNFLDHKSKAERIKFRLNTIDDDFAQATKAALNALSDYKVTICKHSVKGGQDNYALVHGDRELCERLVSETNKKQQIPAWVFDASREEKLAFVAGLMDSEGFVTRKKDPRSRSTNRSYCMGFKSCDVWVPEFLRLLDILGVRYGKVSQEKPRKEGYKVPTGFRIKIQSWIDAGCYFNIIRKESKVYDWASAAPYENRAPKKPRRSTSETLRKAA